ncbi:hypothetical protein A8C75_12720 [Marinobacterium aestuarii]|uniref:Phosphatidylglycerol lysyltransferase n=1 Tax=Marinobacterium aestuarii TaxID=1821621 RepID=A0A1A9F032_9GAMM|nr:bifunctional lysylphosphatidylglycerol flippase/synthetase MprF [Marinobacterium aestuarii]ANG63248.1 hypothetical protein A8C75_12720 [Marinobacterium aestuarii]
MKPIKHILKTHSGSLLAFVVFALGVVAVRALLRDVDIHAVLNQLSAIPRATLIVAMGATFLSYTVLVGYDWSALRYIGKSAPPIVLGFGSFTAYALGNTVGLAVLSGGAVRHRFYQGLGLDARDIAVVSTICAISFGTGVTLVGLAALAYHPAALSAVINLSPAVVRTLSVLLLIALVAILAWGSVRGRATGRYRIRLPRPAELLAQLGFSVGDIALAGLALYVLLPADSSLPYSTFIAVFSAAAVAGVISHVPGGIGVFDSVIIAGVAQSTDQVPGVAAAVLAYRAIYYLLPFVVALVILSLSGPLLRHSDTARRSARLLPLLSLFDDMKPALLLGLSALVFLTGAALLLNGILPIPADVMEEILPLINTNLFEVSNVIMGVVGGALIVLSNGLRRRIRGAFWIVFGMMLFGISTLAYQRVDIDLLVFMVFAVTLLWLSRSEFYRSSKLTTNILSAEWLLLVGGLVLSAFLLIHFAHDDTAYNHERWWQFAADQQLSRSLRLYGTGLFTALFVLLVLALRPARSAPVRTAPFDRAQVAKIIDQQDDADACFVFTGDKYVLMSENEDAFIMYAPRGRSLIALGDPIGNAAAFQGLINQFIDLGDLHNYRPCFYQVGPDMLTRYIDLGFSLSKLGEEAVVPLETLSLEGAPRKRLRQTFSRATRDGLTFEIRLPPHSTEVLDALAVISAEWLSTRNAREKSFSLGRFDREYLQRFPIATVTHEDRILAFANLFQTATRVRATIDLMRHRNDSPPGTMEFLFLSLMLELKAQGYQEFSLGLAPLIGLASSRNKRLWDHLGLAIARFGGHFYNFEGLRAFKEKFSPQWRPHYLATWGGVDPVLVAADVNALVSGGLGGALFKSTQASATTSNHRLTEPPPAADASKAG